MITTITDIFDLKCLRTEAAHYFRRKKIMENHYYHRNHWSDLYFFAFCDILYITSSGGTAKTRSLTPLPVRRQGDIMKNVELKQQAIAYIEQLSTEKLETALNYLAALRNSDLWAAEGELEKRKSSDKVAPLLALAGTLECDEENISDRHDELIGDGLLAELSGRADE